jgi:DNA mismatch endonuclease (patch repair protein)
VTDIVDRATRSRMMSGIRGRDTTPEKIVRSHLHRAGLRYGLHRKDLPGSPDIVLPRWRSAVFVHGCFWHRHPGCRYAYVPKSNRTFWRRKFAANVERDGRKLAALRKMKWRVYVIWECRLSAGRLEQLVRAIRSSRSH